MPKKSGRGASPRYPGSLDTLVPSIPWFPRYPGSLDTLVPKLQFGNPRVETPFRVGRQTSPIAVALLTPLSSTRHATVKLETEFHLVRSQTGAGVWERVNE